MGRTFAPVPVAIGALLCCADVHAQTATVSMPKAQGGIFVDAVVRDWLRAPTPAERRVADDASTVLLGTMIAAPYITSLGNVLARHGSVGDMVGLALVNSEALGIAIGATFLLKSAVGRERPYATAEHLATFCVSHASAPECGSDRNASFFSGHSAIAFTAASLVCTEQIAFGPRGADMLACTSGFGVAAATAILRIVADMHYTTDTLVGAGVGLVAGMLVPYVFHFASWAPFPVARSLRSGRDALPTKPASTVSFQVMPWMGANGGGLGFGAKF